MIKAFSRYKSLEKPVLLMILGEAIVQVLNGAFFLISNLYLKKEGYTDTEISDFIFYRFLGVLFLAMPFGMLIKRKKLMPYFYIASIGMCFASLSVLYGVDNEMSVLAKVSLLIWGLFFMLIEVVKLPFIMRYCKSENHSMALALTFSTWSLGAIVAGIISYALNSVNPTIFDEKNVIATIAVLSLGSMFVFAKIKINEKIPTSVKNGFNLKEYDWGLILKAVFPTLVIAIGAGLTVPFINLFFEKVHGVDFKDFSAIGAIAYAAVFISILLAPAIKDKMGYKKAIPRTQIIAVLMLIGLALTEWMPPSTFAFSLALFFFVARQPLMSLAQPLTSELVLNYVGRRNQELISAFQSTIWNGAFVFSSTIFGILRARDIPFVYIFLLTAILYAVAILLYVFLIRDYENRKTTT